MLIITLCILFFFGEVFTRLFFAHALINEKGHGPGLLAFNKIVKNNSFGYWDVEHTLEKKPGMFRILVFGDSFTYGYGLDRLDDSYPRILQGLLADEYGSGQIEVITIALPGYSTLNELHDLQNIGIRLDPDLVVLGYYTNDAEGPGSRKGFEQLFYGHLIIPYELGSFLYLHSYFYYFLESRIQNVFARLGLVKTDLDYSLHLYSESNPFFSEHWKVLTSFISIPVEKHISVVVALLPTITDFKSYPYQFVGDYVQNITLAAGGHYVDLLSSFANTDPHGVRLSFMDAHPNARGHHIIAQALFDYLTQEHLLSTNL